METLDSCVYGINIKIYYFTVSNSVQSVYIFLFIITNISAIIYNKMTGVFCLYRGNGINSWGTGE